MARLLQDKVAIVTGGGGGLGLAIGTAFGADGAKVLLAGRDRGRLDAAAEKVRGVGGVAATFIADLTAEGGCDEIVEQTLGEFGGVDILVNCAGVFVWKRFLDLEADDWTRTLSTNLTAPFLLSKRVAEVMVEQERGGSILNIASIHGMQPDPNVVPHCAAKAGLIALTQAMAEALRPYDIRVNAISPGAIEPRSAERRGESPQRKVTQADVANLCAYLASDLARSITGSNFEAFGNTHTVIKA